MISTSDPAATPLGPPLGASVVEGGVRFRVWAPGARSVRVRLEDTGRQVDLDPVGRGEHEQVVDEVEPGARYRYVLDGGEPLPDPASRHQPEGPHGPSAVVDPDFSWTDDGWRGRSLRDLVLYELHVGCFTDEGTFDAAIAELPRLVDLGITAVELMPIAEFPGARNWGYDGVFPSAAHHDYGGPDGLRRFVDAAHSVGLAVHLDVVYNHLGPEGNVLRHYGPYFTDRYHTPWGEAVNVDGPGSDQVRELFIDSALWWVVDCHVDGLRLDAVHAIVDTTAYPFVEQLGDVVHRVARSLDREVLVVAESADNDPRLVADKDRGGMALDAVWNDDFHHALHALLTGEQGGYYEDYGALSDLDAAYRETFVLAGRYSASRGRHHGRHPVGIPTERFVVCAQNHDQVGNRLLGERLGTLVDEPRQRLAAAAVLLAPFTPLLFMGEEYGETAPFLYFVSHTDAQLVEAVRRGRAEEFGAFGWEREPPDPADPATFERSKLQVERRREAGHRVLEELHAALLDLRRSHPVLGSPTASTFTFLDETNRVLTVHRHEPGELGPDAVFLLHLGDDRVRTPLHLPEGAWKLVLDTRAFPEPPDAGTLGHGPAGPTLRMAPWSAAVLVHS